MTLVSVVVPTYNRLSLLQQTVASVQAQTHRHFELVIVDDGSNDGTIDWVQAESLNDPRVRLIVRAARRAETRGAQVCRNIGLHMARGDAVLFLDSDDLLKESCLLNRLQLLDSNPAADAVVAPALHFAEVPGDIGTECIWGKWIPGDDDLDHFLAHSIPWQTSGPLWRRSSLDRVGPWDERLIHVGHDHEFHVRALCRGLRFHKLYGVDYYWRVPRADSLSSLESFKTRHRDGGMINAYRAIQAEVIQSGALTPGRRSIIAGEVIRLALCCRSFGGIPVVAEQGLLDARRQGFLDAVTTVVCRLLLRNWWRIAGRIPSMAMLNRLASTPSSAG